MACFCSGNQDWSGSCRFYLPYNVEYVFRSIASYRVCVVKTLVKNCFYQSELQHGPS